MFLKYYASKVYYVNLLVNHVNYSVKHIQLEISSITAKVNFIRLSKQIYFFCFNPKYTLDSSVKKYRK
jgi:hypothetical protein